MKSSAKNIVLKSVDDIFQTEENRADAQRERVQEIPLDQLKPFKNHPFKVRDDQRMLDTADSIREYGVLVPAIARPDPNGGYELISGHRRKRGCEMAGLQTMPVIIRDLDDDAAVLVMVDSNIQREEQPEESDDGQSGTEEPESEISEAEQPHTEKPDAGKSAQSNTHVSKTYSPNTHKSNPYPSHLQVYEADGYDGMENCVDVQTWNRIHAEVERQICFEAYEGTKNGSVVSEIVELMTEICCMPGGMMRISGVPYSVEVVKKRFRELTSSHIDTLLWSMKRSSREIRNIRGYLLTSLFQAPTTKENIFEADMRYRGLA